MSHIPVLLHEAIDGLAPTEGDLVLDATVGNGGHAKEICKGIGKTGVLVGLDQDEKALEEAEKNLGKCHGRVMLRKENFRNLREVLREEKINGIDKALFDLGLRSEQIELSGRGFTFRKDEPLLMTFDSDSPSGALSAYEIVNSWPEDEIARILREYGEERFAGKIAKNIVRSRRKEKIDGTLVLARIVSESIPAGQRKKIHPGKSSGRSSRPASHGIHPATKTFQALRIAVNDELDALREGLEEASDMLQTGGRIAVISYHSLEDRIVKQFFKKMAEGGLFKILTKKPMAPSTAEIQKNPRARSAKLRILQKI